MFLGLVFTSAGWGLVARKTALGLEAWNFQPCPATSGERRRSGGLKSWPMTSNWIIILACNGTSIETPEQWGSGSVHTAELLEGGIPREGMQVLCPTWNPQASLSFGPCWVVSSIINWWLSSKESACQCRVQFQSLGWEGPLEKEMAIHFSILEHLKVYCSRTAEAWLGEFWALLC